MTEERRIQITDVRVLRALANPIRYRILGHLMSSGAQTASECAAVVGATPSNCSYHLRELERFGLVERAGGNESTPDGRDRPWRPTVTGYGTGPSDAAAVAGDSDPAAVVAAQALSHLGIDDNAALAHAAVDAHASQSPAWQAAEVIATYGLLVSADELTMLYAAVDGLLRPYIGLTRSDAPAEAERVHVVFDAFLRPAATLPT
jgi:DNA-binding transcriptional ArsR family regulator